MFDRAPIAALPTGLAPVTGACAAITMMAIITPTSEAGRTRAS